MMNENDKRVITLSNGVQMPCMAVGTNWMNYSELKNVMTSSFAVGFRAIDTARDYGNEPVVGKVLHDIIKASKGMYKREDFFLTTKIGNGQQIKGDIDKEIDISLKISEQTILIYGLCTGLILDILSKPGIKWRKFINREK